MSKEDINSKEKFISDLATKILNDHELKMRIMNVLISETGKITGNSMVEEADFENILNEAGIGTPETIKLLVDNLKQNVINNVIKYLRENNTILGDCSIPEKNPKQQKNWVYLAE